MHGVQRLSNANNRYKHMADADKQKKDLAAVGGTKGKTAWVWGFEPVQEWDKAPVVPEAYADPA